MVGKEIKKLSRRELVDIIYLLKKNEQTLQEKVESLEAALEDKRLRIANAGSIAEAAVEVTNVISAAQQTAELYLQEIAFLREEAERECEKMRQEAHRQAEEIVADAKAQYNNYCLLYKSEYRKWQNLRKQVTEEP